MSQHGSDGASGGAIETAAFGATREGQPVTRYTLRNRSGIAIAFISLGGIVTRIEAPDRAGRIANVTLGFASVADYEQPHAGSFGALIGRYANRIGHARFALDGTEYRLSANDGDNSLHGGARGFNRAVWTVAARESAAGIGALLTHTSPDGDQGFPGTLRVTVGYTLTANGEFHIEYEAATDRPTVLNLTNHAYFNLAGEGSGSVADHLLQIAADRYTPVDAALIPTGETALVAGTPLDFRRPVPIGARLRSAHEQMRRARGYDHNFVLSKRAGGELSLAARVHEPQSGRILEVLTTEPGVQFYSGNMLTGALVGGGGASYRQTDGLALETQHFPDSPNRPDFPSTVLRPGEVFRSRTVWRFLTDSATEQGASADAR